MTAFAFFLLNMESAKLSVKRGDTFDKARKCQIYKQFIKDYRFPTTKVMNRR